MIHISRDRIDTAGRSIRPDGAWFNLSTEWTEKAKKEGSGHSIGEHVYQNDSVKMALEELFHYKCAYCETPLGEADWQVEHFRPKRRVAERPDHHGYYWLAYTWENLYPSCIPCNQRRRCKPSSGKPIKGKKAGKADQFPIEDEAFRVMDPGGDIAIEKPLLLDPCVDNPEEIFRYTTIGEIYASGDDSRAEESIRVLGFKDRSWLAGRREKRIKAVIELLELLRILKELGDQACAGKVERLLETEYFADSSPYAGAARFVRKDPDAFAFSPARASGSSPAA